MLERFCLIDPMSQCGESMHQPIIPGLPDDLGIRCLAMLSHGYHGVMETVSKRWRDLMRSEEYANCKAREGWSGDWLFVLTERSRHQGIIAYDPEADRWHPLPPTPHSHYGLGGLGCQCACNKLFVIGGTYERFDGSVRLSRLDSSEVFQFDPFKKEWSTAASMRTPRSTFASCVMDGKIYVAGGHNCSDYREGMNLAEVYDPLTDKWEDLPPMHKPTESCTGIAYEGKFHVITVRRADHSLLYETQVFDPLSRSWREKHEDWSPRWHQVAAADDQVYTIHEWSGWSKRIERRDAEKDEWHIVGEVPLLPVFEPNNLKAHELFYTMLAALGHELYVIDGKDYPKNDGEVVGLDRVRVCDPRSSPLIWRETRPMCLSASGCIMVWASLKQQ